MTSTPKPVGAELRRLKSRAQLLQPVVTVGKSGLSTELFSALDQALSVHDLAKVKFAHFKERKRELVPELVTRSGSHLILRVGNVAVLYRPRPSAGPETA